MVMGLAWGRVGLGVLGGMGLEGAGKGGLGKRTKVRRMVWEECFWRLLKQAFCPCMCIYRYLMPMNVT